MSQSVTDLLTDELQNLVEWLFATKNQAPLNDLIIIPQQHQLPVKSYWEVSLSPTTVNISRVCTERKQFALLYFSISNIL